MSALSSSRLGKRAATREAQLPPHSGARVPPRAPQARCLRQPSASLPPLAEGTGRLDRGGPLGKSGGPAHRRRQATGRSGIQTVSAVSASKRATGSSAADDARASARCVRGRRRVLRPEKPLACSRPIVNGWRDRRRGAASAGPLHPPGRAAVLSGSCVLLRQPASRSAPVRPRFRALPAAWRLL